MTHPAVRKGLLIALLALSGCLPHSCRREESSQLTPSDSLSREIAASIPADTLELVWRSVGDVDHALEHPRTVRFTGADTLFVSDVERNSLFMFGGDGRSVQEVPLPELELPYIAGVRGDTLAVFSPSRLRMDFLAEGAVVHSFDIQDDERTKHSLVYASLGEDVFYKRVNGESGGVISMLDDSGRVVQSRALSGPHWRLAGMLRAWGDTLLSLSGFRPVVDVVTADSAGGLHLDTLALRGFDSPMLARSRSFMAGDTHQAPLLSAAAAPAGDLLFVLNLRAGWLQIDIFDREGLLRHRLVQRNQEYRRAYYPQDLDVWRLGDGSYRIAVVFSAPEPAVEVYRWNTPVCAAC